MSDSAPSPPHTFGPNHEIPRVWVPVDVSMDECHLGKQLDQGQPHRSRVDVLALEVGLIRDLGTLGRFEVGDWWLP